MTQKIQITHFGFFDGIRGYLAMCVLLTHLMIIVIGRNPPFVTPSLWIDVFMTLSGFLMAYHWLFSQQHRSSRASQARRYYIRRWFRIAPLYYTVLVIALIGHEFWFEYRAYFEALNPPPWSRHPDYAGPPVAPELTPLNVLSHFTFLFGFVPEYAASNILPDWSIGLEAQFYMAFPILFGLLIRFPIATLIATVVITELTAIYFGLYIGEGIIATFPQPTFIAFKINLFIGGMCLARACFAATIKPRWVWIGASAFAWYFSDPDSIWLTDPEIWLYWLLIVVLLFIKNPITNAIDWFLSNRLATFLGETSYALYLLHFFVMYPVIYALYQTSWYGDMNEWLRLFVGFVTISALLYPLSYLAFRFIEKPGIAAGKKVIARFNP